LTTTTTTTTTMTTTTDAGTKVEVARPIPSAGPLVPPHPWPVLSGPLGLHAFDAAAVLGPPCPCSVPPAACCTPDLSSRSLAPSRGCCNKHRQKRGTADRITSHSRNHPPPWPRLKPAPSAAAATEEPRRAYGALPSSVHTGCTTGAVGATTCQ
jgi:hypothetical protein